MKPINIISLILSIIAVGISTITLVDRKLPKGITPPYGNNPREVALKLLDRPRFDGTSKFIQKNIQDLKSNLEVVNFLETEGVGIAFIRTKAQDKQFQYHLWMRKIDSGWEWVSYLSVYNEIEPFRKKWIEKNHDWIEEMREKGEEWTGQSQSVW